MEQQSRVAESLPVSEKRSPTCSTWGEKGGSGAGVFTSVWLPRPGYVARAALLQATALCQ